MPASHPVARRATRRRVRRPYPVVHSPVKTCAACGVENPDSARFCSSCGSSLVPSCPTCGAEVPIEARFCPACGSALEPLEPVPPGQERRLVTILFADVASSTSLGERLDSERLQEVLATYFGAMREELEAEGGTVEKFIGDAVMAAFGVPAAHEDDPSRALRAALRTADPLRALERSAGLPRGQPRVRRRSRAPRPARPPRSPRRTDVDRRRPARARTRCARARTRRIRPPRGGVGTGSHRARPGGGVRLGGRTDEARAAIVASAADLERVGALIETDRLRSIRARLA